MATMLILFLSSAFKTGCNSSSVTAKSPSTTAFSSLPANAAHVFTPIVLSILTPCIFAGRPIVNFTIPSFASPCVSKISLSGAALIEFFSASDGCPTTENDFHVVAGESDFVNPFLLVQLPFEAGEIVDLRGIKRSQRAQAHRGKNRRQGKKLFHW